MIENIESIIFDLGGVIINIDPALTHQAFEKVGVKDTQSLFTITHQAEIFAKYERADLSSAQFRDELRKMAATDIADAAIDQAWNALVLDIPPHRMEILKRLKQKYPLYLLSNINEIHRDAVHGYMAKSYGLPDLSSLFDKVYYSFEMKLRKPEREIFERVLKEQNLNPATTLFVDDNRHNIEMAKSLGIQTILADKDIQEYFGY